MARQPLVFCPAHSGEKSPLPSRSACARSGAMAAVASGKAGATGLSGPSSRITRLTMPLAGRPVKRRVSAVWRAASLCSAARCTALVVASGQAAVTYAIQTIAEAGDNIISSTALYGDRKSVV